MKKMFGIRLMPFFLGCIGLLLGLMICFANEVFRRDKVIYIWLVAIIAHAIIWYYLGNIIERYKQLSYKDSLTGLYNRRYFYEILNMEFKRIRRDNSFISLLFIDVDNFKRINDTYGHKYGDHVLIKLSNILKREIRDVDIVSRWGGEEFIVALHDTDIDGSRIVAERLRMAVEKQKFQSNITISIGVTATDGSTSVEKLVGLADDALYKAKEQKNMVIVFNPNIIADNL